MLGFVVFRRNFFSKSKARLIQFVNLKKKFHTKVYLSKYQERSDLKGKADPRAKRV